jgi:hypothetical protein
MSKTIRIAFVKEFGEDTAKAIEAAANEHENGLHPDQGKDPFKWALLLAISYQCFELPDYRKHHKIKPAYSRIKKWIKTNGRLDTYDGDVDYLAVVTGAYDYYMPKKRVKS